MKELQGRSETMYIGGPVSISRVIVLMRSSTAAEGAEPILTGVYATGSIDTLRQFLSTAGPSDALHAYAGYAGWSGGQLESEVERGDWYLVPGDAATLFDSDPHHIWHDLLRQASGRWVRGPMLDAPVPARVALGSDVRLSRPHAERPGR